MKRIKLPNTQIFPYTLLNPQNSAQFLSPLNGKCKIPKEIKKPKLTSIKKLMKQAIHGQGIKLKQENPKDFVSGKAKNTSALKTYQIKP